MSDLPGGCFADPGRKQALEVVDRVVGLDFGFAQIDNKHHVVDCDGPEMNTITIESSWLVQSVNQPASSSKGSKTTRLGCTTRACVYSRLGNVCSQHKLAHPWRGAREDLLLA